MPVMGSTVHCVAPGSSFNTGEFLGSLPPWVTTYTAPAASAVIARTWI